jgi:hypothetical protein
MGYSVACCLVHLDQRDCLNRILADDLPSRISCLSDILQAESAAHGGSNVARPISWVRTSENVVAVWYVVVALRYIVGGGDWCREPVRSVPGLARAEPHCCTTFLPLAGHGLEVGQIKDYVRATSVASTLPPSSSLASDRLGATDTAGQVTLAPHSHGPDTLVQCQNRLASKVSCRLLCILRPFTSRLVQLDASRGDSSTCQRARPDMTRRWTSPSCFDQAHDIFGTPKEPRVIVGSLQHSV